ncbi:RagB/SusD family nutrient uptake outer membrane protein [Zobellia amurskyensis]|uniref:RagB/SusD family nutrient uptake outer membrane protein n=1 Tax=Zobellia amurskyensis TaxID=248905 RepID=A0A7X3D3F8_9FLAO|nr:RagB/SusD family nutrient uptake outer membrane protein [Zobellia amurskyensis]MUH38254.1 RagB/SusD family nutrient uptake outer membrane protein [Zobellia amurskyensis]
MTRILDIILILVASFLFFSCENDVLDKEPLGLISNDNVWQNENLVNLKLNESYKESLFLNMGGNSGFEAGLDGNMAGEFKNYAGWQTPNRASTGIIDETGSPAGAVQNWDYSLLRDINDIILNLETVSTLNEDFKEARISEARFLRAYLFFHMVKRYGGVPILTKPQSLEATPEELFVFRNSEEEVYDFIISETEAISEILPETPSQGRPSKWAALALKSRAALYAGSIGEYGAVQLDGLLGISNPDKYWQIAYDTSKKIINESGHALYMKYDDKVKNFQELFIDEESNSEVIFAESFDATLNSHSWNFLALPQPFDSGWASNFFVFYDTVELFDFADGTSGKVDRSTVDGQEIDLDEFFGTRDPRFIASIFYPGSDWMGDHVYFHDNTINIEDAPDGWEARAAEKNRNLSNGTGFLVRKRIDESHVKPAKNTDDTDYIVFRLGEIYLNLAEAAFHIQGKKNEALTNINIIRERAGMPARTELTLDNIQQERRVELFAEDQAYWDLRRWRIAKEVLDGVKLQGLKYTYNGTTGKYYIEMRRGESTGPRVFQERHYYLPLTVGRINDNPNLVENPGY